MLAIGLFKMYTKAGIDKFWITFLTDYGKIIETEIPGHQWKHLALALQDQGINKETIGSTLTIQYTYYSMVTAKL